MKCNNVEQAMASYLDDEVTPDEREAIQHHLSSCPHCRKTMDELTKAQAYLRQSFQTATEKVSASSKTWQEIGQRIEADEQPRSVINRWREALTGNKVSRPAAWKFGTAITVLVVLVIGLVMTIPPDDDSSDVDLISNITENDPQVREAIGGGKVSILDVKLINGTGCVLAGGETGFIVEACVDLHTKEVTSLANFGQLFAY